LRVFENIGVDALENEFFLRVTCDDVGVVDVAVAEFPDIEDIPARVELLCDEG